MDIRALNNESTQSIMTTVHCYNSVLYSRNFRFKFQFVIRKEKSNKIEKCIKLFYYSLFIWSSTCFRRHTTHHQEPKTGFLYVEVCWTCSSWTLSGTCL